MNRGDVFTTLPAYPHGSRPMLVVQADYYNRKISKVLLATITSNTSRAADPAHPLIDVSTPAGKATGLHQNSVVSCINIVLASKSDLDQKVGEFSDALMSQIDDCLKAAFGL